MGGEAMQRRDSLGRKSIFVEKYPDVLIPTDAEMLRIKIFMAMQRLSLRDFLDVAALSDAMSDDEVSAALASFEDCYADLIGKTQNGVWQKRAFVRLTMIAVLGDCTRHLQEKRRLEDGLDPSWACADRVEAACRRVACLALRQAVACEPLPGGWIWCPPLREQWQHVHRNIVDPQSRSFTAIENVFVRVPDNIALCAQALDLLTVICKEPSGEEAQNCVYVLTHPIGDEAHDGIRHAVLDLIGHLRTKDPESFGR